jgi:hypothetical protein
MQTFLKILTIVLLILGSSVFYSCKYTSPPAYGNLPPITRLSNVPPQDTVITASNPRLTLSWVGDDPDGYIIGYKYRWSYTIGGVKHQHQWGRILNISTVANLALMIDSTVTSDEAMFPVYHYFATLPPEGLDTALQTRLVIGDTILIAGIKVFASNAENIDYPIHTNPTSGTFIFDSEDSLNYHTFEVAAIDDKGVASAFPATVDFITPHVAPPKTSMVYPAADRTDTIYVSDKTTDTWPGILFQYKATDPNSRTIQYSFNVDSVTAGDSLVWSPWSSSTSTYINATHFKDPYATRHVFSVRAKNEFGSIDTLGYYLQNDDSTGTDTVRGRVYFNTIFPNFLRPGYKDTVLVFNTSYKWDSTGQVSNSRPHSDSIKAFYTRILNQLGIPFVYTTYQLERFPTQAKLAHYRVTLIVADCISEQAKYYRSAMPVFDATGNQVLLRDYAYIGGSLVTSSINMPYASNAPLSGVLFPSVFHAVVRYPDSYAACWDDGPGAYRGTASIIDHSFAGATGIGGYPNVTVDATKLDTAYLGLPSIWSVSPEGFGEYIYSFNGIADTSCFNGKNIGVRYRGVSFNSIFLGFPLYFVPESTALLVLKRAFQDCEIELP